MKKIQKKLTLGAASLALIGGMAPMLTNDTYAYSEFPLDLSETFYTTVGPDYFTFIDLYNYDYVNDVSIRVADTSIADRYYGSESTTRGKSAKRDTKSIDYIPESSWCGEYEDFVCIQGKKIGETELIITVNGETSRVPLKSVELTPEANNVGVFGDKFTGSASIEGADEGLLHLETYNSSESVSVTIRGNRGTEYTVRAQQNNDYLSYKNGAMLLWGIGDQVVGGGTYFTFYPVEIENNVNDSEETNEELKASTLALLMELDNEEKYWDAFDNQYVRINNIELNTGAIANVSFTQPNYPWAAQSYKTSLDLEDAELSSSAKEKLAAKLPEKVGDASFKAIYATIDLMYRRYSGGGEYVVGDVISRPIDVAPSLGDEIYSMSFAEFTKLGKEVEVTLDASELPALKNGYTRKLYVAIEDGNKVELVDGEYNEKTKTFTFKTNLLGNFAYGYADELVPKVPDTGIAPKNIVMVTTATFTPLTAIALGAFIARSKKKAAHKLAKKINR